MNGFMLELLVFALVVIIAGLLWIFSLVRELQPDERRNWLLGIGLGSGVIAFSLKIGFVVVFGNNADSLLSLIPEREFVRHSPSEIALDEFKFSSSEQAYRWEALPLSVPYPQDNPLTPQKVALGKTLFFDQRLSADGTLSCASCHEISHEKGGADGLTTSLGIEQQKGGRNAPSVLNAAYQRVLFWDGRAASLEEQAKGPLVNPVEMGMPSLDAVVNRVKAVPQYQLEFDRVFSERPSITIDNVARAIASFERTLVTPQSPYDRFVRGDKSALSQQQIRGMVLFETKGCTVCHSGPNFSDASVFSDQSPYRIFPANPDPLYEKKYQLSADPGAVTAVNNESGGVWRIPSLRNVSRTAPYFHNGSVESLEEAVRIMARVQLDKKISNSSQDNQSVHWLAKGSRFSVSNEQAISDTEVEEIVAFLEALNGELPEI